MYIIYKYLHVSISFWCVSIPLFSSWYDFCATRQIESQMWYSRLQKKRKTNNRTNDWKTEETIVQLNTTISSLMQFLCLAKYTFRCFFNLFYFYLAEFDISYRLSNALILNLFLCFFNIIMTYSIRLRLPLVHFSALFCLMPVFVSLCACVDVLNYNKDFVMRLISGFIH